jgi:hypothetical protein
VSLTADDLATQVPSIEELWAVCEVSCLTVGGISAVSRASGFRKTVWVGGAAPVAILGLYLAFEYWSQPASDSAYWTFRADIGAGGSYVACAQRSTRNTGPDANGAITARVPWTFDAAAWGPSIVTAGQIMTLNIWPTGTPPAILLPMSVGVRYAPQ